jgi:fructuronate reductase
MDTLHRLLPEVVRFSYDRSVQAAGIVHFGIGAFHRAHQAWYTDLAMAGGDRDWAITGVSLRSADVAGQMNPQDGLFTLAERSAAGMALRVVGSVREVLVASQDGVRLAARLAAPATRIVSLTITEKGYCRAADGSLDAGLAGGASIYRHLANAFRARRDAGIAGLTLLSCDNLSGNGAQLQRLMAEYLNTHEPDLVGWFEAECACPSTMVDRIVPATTPEDRDCLESLLGLRDEAAVITEPFSQWVIEDRFVGSRPRWEMAGAQFVADVGAYETAKLRMLNGAHSALAYLGLERGHDFVHEAIADPALRPIIERLMREEAATSFAPAQGQDLQAYADGLIGRFANPALQHRLIQIAMDGSQKIPQRWIETLAAHKLRGQRCPAILTALGAWLRHVRGDGQPVSDPLAADLAALWQGVDHAGAAQGAFAADGPMRGGWSPDAEELAVMTAA